MNKVRRLPPPAFFLLVVWAAFTISLTVWWVIFGISQLDLMHDAGLQSSDRVVSGHRMLLWEGATLIFSLLGGAIAFYFFAARERRQSRAVNDFLLTFTHELKTPIASLRLQTEELQETAVKDSREAKLLDRLLQDTARLTLQLDNSLFLASAGNERAIFENLDLREVINGIAYEWPSLQLSINRDATVKADVRMLQSIFRNLIHNSIVHGKAKQVAIEISNDSTSGKLQIFYKDDGKGLQGKADRVGQLFYRHYSGSGSGVGLHLVERLASQLGGEFTIKRQPISGFQGSLILHGTLRT